jgi:hypothetical protein
MSDVETTLRGPEAYKIAARALELMERHQVWPTALNFELWTHYVADPDGALARELTRLISLGEPMTELVSEELAATYLPKARLNEQIRDAGDILSKELEAVSKAIQNAQKSNAAFGKQLAGASKSLDGRPTSRPSRPWSRQPGRSHPPRAQGKPVAGNAPGRLHRRGRAPARAPGTGPPRRHHRRPDQPGQPQGLRRRAGARLLRTPTTKAAPSAWPCSTSTTSKASTTPGATRRATRSSATSPR